jgi:alkylhydroperoxidase family enzyme
LDSGSRDSKRPRIPPGDQREIGRVNTGIARLIGLSTGGPPPRLFTTLARHRRLYRKWLRFAGALMPGGSLPRSDSEVLILRTAHNCDCEYEWLHHERLGQEAGLTPEQIATIGEDGIASTLPAEHQLLLEAADELHTDRRLSHELWERLRPGYDDAQLIEICMLVGHYEMLAMTINSLEIQPDRPPTRKPPRMIRAVQAALSRRGGG